MSLAVPLRVAALAGALALGAASARAEPVSPGEFEALAEGMTLHFGLDGIPFGAEQFFAGRRSLWQFADGTCQEGRWWDEGGLICFAYPPEPAELCWRLTRENGRLFAENMTQGGLRLDMIRRDEIPLPCPGPDVGS
jgi:hypothetical protein